MANAKYDIDWCKSYAVSKGGICLSDEYLGRTKRLTYICANGHQFTATPFAHISKGSWCNECSNRDVAHDLDFVSKFVQSKGGILLSTEYINVRQKLTVDCGKGHIWNPTFQNLLHNGSWCPTCSGVGRRTYGNRIRTKS